MLMLSKFLLRAVACEWSVSLGPWAWFAHLVISPGNQQAIYHGLFSDFVIGMDSRTDSLDLMAIHVQCLSFVNLYFTSVVRLSAHSTTILFSENGCIIYSVSDQQLPPSLALHPLAHLCTLI